MPRSLAPAVDAYLADLPADRRAALEAVRTVILQNLPAGFEEGMEFGMITYSVPLARYPDTYNGHALGIASLVAQKDHLAVYLMGIYGHDEMRKWFVERYVATGKPLDMAKACVRFRSLDDLPLDLVGEVIGKVSVDECIARYEAGRKRAAKRR